MIRHVRTHRMTSLSLLLWACNGDTTATTTATTASTGTEEMSDTTAPEVTTGNDDPTADVSDTGTTSASDPTAPTGTTDTSTGGDMPPLDCPETTPAPADCGRLPETCGNATPIAGGPAVYVYGTAVTHDHVWFQQNAGAGCPVALYRVPKEGGDAQWIRPMNKVLDVEADDDAVYFVEKTRDPYTMGVIALADGVETIIGETHGDPDFNSYFYTFLTRTLTGVVSYDSGGQKQPPFFHLTPTALTVIGNEGDDDAYLGSEPAYDGERLFFSLNDPSFDDEEGHVSVHQQLLGLVGGTSVVLADNATARGWPTVAVDAEYVYFATGDPGKAFGEQPDPMGISRLAKSGGPATPLFASADIGIDKVLVDDTHVYYHQLPHDIFAVEKIGGTPRHVWHGEYEVDSEQIQQDADSLYFAVHAHFADIPLPGRYFIVRVAKDTTIP